MAQIDPTPLVDCVVLVLCYPKVFLENPNELIKAVAAMNINRSYEKSIHIQNLQKKINSL